MVILPGALFSVAAPLLYKADEPSPINVIFPAFDTCPPSEYAPTTLFFVEEISFPSSKLTVEFFEFTKIVSSLLIVFWFL